jgi:hypothetical protein
MSVSDARPGGQALLGQQLLESTLYLELKYSFPF